MPPTISLIFLVMLTAMFAALVLFLPKPYVKHQQIALRLFLTYFISIGLAYSSFIASLSNTSLFTMLLTNTLFFLSTYIMHLAIRFRFNLDVGRTLVTILIVNLVLFVLTLWWFYSIINSPFARVVIVFGNSAIVTAASLLLVKKHKNPANKGEKILYFSLVYSIAAGIFTMPLSYIFTAPISHYYDIALLRMLSVEVMLFGGIYTSYLFDLIDRHYIESITDSATGLYNRRYLNQAASKVLSAASRHDWATSLIICDIDEFKKINDTYGHSAGDIAIINCANALKSATREEDILARVGGDEFVILLPNTGIHEATKIANRMQVQFRSLTILDNPGVPNTESEVKSNQSETESAYLSASFGVTQVDPKLSLDAAFKCADEALYQAKQQGRNRVIESSFIDSTHNLSGNLAS